MLEKDIRIWELVRSSETYEDEIYEKNEEIRRLNDLLERQRTAHSDSTADGDSDSSSSDS